MSVHSYDEAFMQYAAQSSIYSARVITASLGSWLGIRSVLDVGCATGTWLRAWSDLGVGDYQGIDGNYVDCAMLQVPAERFAAVDLNGGFDLGRKFDLVQSLEVGEHIAPASSQIFVDSIAQHAARFVLFSAAPPGQGEENHVNERPYEFWRDALARHGFVVLDAVRPAVIADTRISYWYRYNIFLYVRRECLHNLDPTLQAMVVPEGAKLADVSPLAYRMRKAMVRQLPYRLQHEIARLKARFLPTGRI
jgi:SAM-dependent methyltransferase